MVFKVGPVVVPTSDARLGLPRLFLKLVRKRHFEVAGECSPYRLGDQLQVHYSFQATAVRLHILVVVIRHNLRSKIWNTQPDLQVEFGPAVIEIELRTVIKIEDVGTVLIDHILHAQEKLLDELRAGTVLHVWPAVDHLGIHSLPPFALTVERRLQAVIRDARERARGGALIANGKELIPDPMRRPVIADPEPQAIGTGDLFPRSHDVAFRTDVHAIPGLIL